MFAALAQGAGHPAVAAWLALGTVGLAAVVVAMAWSVNTRQIRLAELLAKRQFPVVSGTSTAGRGLDKGGTDKGGTDKGGTDKGGTDKGGTDKGGTAEIEGAVRTDEGASRAKKAPPEVIEGPDEVVAGEQARYRIQPTGPHRVVSWAVGGGPVSHAPDPAHPDELLLIADQPGDLTIIARVREGLAERRATKSVTAVPEPPDPTPPFTLRLFLHGWGLVVVAVLIIGFAGALDALGNFTSSDFIALAVPLAALLGVIAVARGASEAGGRAGNGHGLGKRHSQL
jgi:hypothetical protein